MTFWGGSESGSGDPCLLLMDPDPAILFIDLQDANKKLIFNTLFSTYYFLKIHLHHFSKIKSQKESQNSRNQGFSYYFCMIIEGSGSGSGSIPLTSGSRSGRPKSMWIRWIRNTGPDVFAKYLLWTPPRRDSFWCSGPPLVVSETAAAKETAVTQVQNFFWICR